MIFDKMSCGNCGNSEFLVYGNGSEVTDGLVIVCTKCKSDTIASVARPRLALHWGSGDGKLCIMEEDENIVVSADLLKGE